jgi:hypothetical protein
MQQTLDKFENVGTEVERKACIELAQRASVALTALDGAAANYVELVRFVNQCSLVPQQVRRILASRGFEERQIRRIQQIAYGVPDVLAQYEARVIGFYSAVERNRRGARQPGTDEELKGLANKIFRRLEKWGEERFEVTLGEWTMIAERKGRRGAAAKRPLPSP